MPLDFPNSPSVGQIFADWTWDGTKWKASAASGTSTITVGDTPPPSPVAGALWWSSADGQMYLYYVDANSSQWVPANNTNIGGAPLASPAFTGNPTAPTAAYGDADTSVATTAFVAAAVAPALNDVGRNLLHNSMFNVQQRGAGAWTVAGNYTADRWLIGLVSDTVSVSVYDQGVATIAVDEDLRYILLNVFTGNAAAGAYNIIIQPIERLRRLSGKTVTVSFYAWATSGTPRLGVSLDQIFGTGGSPSGLVGLAGQSVQLTTGVVRYSLMFTVPSINGKTLGTNGDDHTNLNLWYSAGSSFNTRSGNVGVQSATIAIWGVQLEIGTQATPLEKIDYGDDLRRCQRFYTTDHLTSYGAGASGGQLRVPLTLPVNMRALPTVVINAITNPGITTPTITTMSSQSIQIGGTMNAASYGLEVIYTASADI